MAHSVMIVEDEPFISEALEFLLSREGYTVFTHEDGASALDRITEVSPELVILDIMLPGRSGMQILEDLRSHSATLALPVLMLTAKGQSKDRQAAEEAGASLFMTKPFSNQDIIDNVARLLTRE